MDDSIQKTGRGWSIVAACLASLVCSTLAPLAPLYAQGETEAETEATADTPDAKPVETDKADKAADAEASGAKDADDKAADDAEPELSPLQLEMELDSANRVSDQLDTLLAKAKPRSKPFEDSLIKLAARCQVIANSVMSDQAKLILLSARCRALAALSLFKTGESPAQTRAERLARLRSAAGTIGSLIADGARASSDYWLLTADLADLADNADAADTLADRQAKAEKLINAYLYKYAQSPQAGAATTRQHLADARLSLARLLDQRGDQPAAAKQLDAIDKLIKLDKTNPRTKEVHRLRARAKLIGKPAKLQGVSTQVEVWKLAEQLGSTVLIHVYADKVPSSVKMIGQIQAVLPTLATQAKGGLRIVSVRVGKADATATAPSWPTLPIELDNIKVLSDLGVNALPTLIWIDPQGKVAAIGHTLAVLDQMPKAPAPDPADPEPADVEDDADADVDADVDAKAKPPTLDELEKAAEAQADKAASKAADKAAETDAPDTPPADDEE